MNSKILALGACTLLSAAALADDAVVVEPAVDQAAVIETAKLDTTAVEETAALEAFGLSSSVTTGLIFAGVAAVTFTVTTDGNAAGIQVPPIH